MTYAESELMKAREFLEEQYATNTKTLKPTTKNIFTKGYALRLRAVLFYQFFRQFTGPNYFALYTIKIFDAIGQNGAMLNTVMS